MGRSLGAGGLGAAGFSTAGAAGGCAAIAGGVCGFADADGCTGDFTRVAGRGGGAGCSISCCRCFSSLATSPGLEILERSIFGLISGDPVLSLEDELDLAAKCFLTFSASSGSTELE